MTPDAGAKARFLADPLRFDEMVPPPEWIAEGWRDECFRDAIVYVLARSVSKVGTFGLAGNWLQLVAQALSRPDAQDLYARIRDESERLEMEWRPLFETAFPDCPLPPSLDSDVVLADLRAMVDEGAGLGFEPLLKTLLALPVAERELDPSHPDSLISRAKEKKRAVMLSILEDARRGLRK